MRATPVTPRRVLRACRGRGMGLGYAALVVGTTVTLTLLPGDGAARVVSASSTNLVNLRQHPPLVLVVSAFVEPDLAQLWIVVPLVWVLGAVQAWLGRAATAVTVVLGHVGSTLFVATILTAGITKGRIALAEATATDVGVSYGLVTALGLLSGRLTPAGRRWYVPAVTAVLVTLLAVGRSFTDLGHLTAWALGLALAVLVAGAGPAGRRPVSGGPSSPS